MTKEEFNQAIASLTDEEKKWLDNFGREPVLRIFMETDEIKKVNKLVKRGLMEKGKSHDGYVQYYIDSYVWTRI